MQIDHKCEHAACKCILASDQRYCSDHCANHEHADPECACGHSDCDMSAEIPAELAMA